MIVKTDLAVVVVDPDVGRGDVRVSAVGAGFDIAPCLGIEVICGWRGVGEQAVFEIERART